MLSVIERNLVDHFVKFALPVTEKLFMAREEDFVINFGYVAQHPDVYFPGVAWLSLSAPSAAIQLEVHSQMQIGHSLFGAQKFSIKGENWIALMLISDHD